MTPLLNLTLPINPQPQQRARVVTAAGARARARAFTPAATRGFYDELRWRVRAAGVRTPVEGPIELRLRFWRRCRGVPGDLSNLVKAVEDAGNGVLWRDDRQVRLLRAELVGWGPVVVGRVEVGVWRYEPETAL